MYIYKNIVTLPHPVEKVFAYISTNANFPLWLKDVWIAGRTIGEMGVGCSYIQTIRIMHPRKFSMKVTGYVKNRYFRLEAMKGFMALPGYCFSFKPVNGNHTEVTIYASIKGKIFEINEDLKNLRIFYPFGVSELWKVYLELLEEAIKKESV